MALCVLVGECTWYIFTPQRQYRHVQAKPARGAAERFFLGLIRDFKKVAPRPSGVWTVAAKWAFWPPFYDARISGCLRRGSLFMGLWCLLPLVICTLDYAC